MTNEQDNGTTYEAWKPDAALIEERELGSDVWFARRFAQEHGDTLKFVWSWGKWYAWDASEGRWKQDDAAPWAAAKATVKKLLEEVSEVETDTARAMLKAAKRFLNRSAIDSALKLAQSEERIIARHDQWDADPFLLNVANGTVDLHDGSLRKHSRGDFCTKMAGAALGSDCPRWRSFLERILPDAAVRDYMQRAIGYSAIGEVREHVLHVLWGAGANGKSVFVNTIGAALGDYAVSVPPALMLANGHQEHPTLLAGLHGARFAVASETNEDGRFDCATMKMLTGGDVLSARRMREDYWQFKPSHTLWLATNHKPRASDTSNGFWRRIRLIPFNVTIPAEEQDHDLARKLREELPGVLGWVVEGCLRYMEQGLDPPAEVKAATEGYKREEDVFGDFLESCRLVADASAFMPSKVVHDLYTQWAVKAGFKPLGQRALTRRLKDRGIQDARNESSRGFRLRQE